MKRILRLIQLLEGNGVMKRDKWELHYGLSNATAFKAAIESVAKVITAPEVERMMLKQAKLASGMFASLIEQQDVQSKIAHLAFGATVAASEQMSGVFANLQTETAVNIDRMLEAASVPCTFAQFGRDLKKQQHDQMAALTNHMGLSHDFSAIGFDSFSRPSFEPRYLPRYQRVITPKPLESGASDFMKKLKEHIQEADEDAGVFGGSVVITCKTPNNDKIRVSEVSLEDEHFISVKGIDEFGQTRHFKAHHSGVGITIEVVPKVDAPRRQRIRRNHQLDPPQRT